MPEVTFQGPEGRIEGRYHQSTEKGAPAALVLHPHPRQGGTMNNKVAYNIYQSFVRQGFSTLRFNFRGVGKSQGVYDAGIGELSDAATALDWLQQTNPNAKSFWIGGFSFGAWIALQLLMRRPELEGFICVSPPAGKFDFNFLSPCPASGIIIQGNNDSIVNEADVAKLTDKIVRQKASNVRYQVVDNADHFFREKIDILNNHIEDYIKESLIERANRPKKVKLDRRRRKPVVT